MTENNEKSTKPITEKLTYNFSITNVETNLKTDIKNATLPFIKKFIDNMQAGLRKNVSDGKKVSGKKSYTNKSKGKKG